MLELLLSNIFGLGCSEAVELLGSAFSRARNKYKTVKDWKKVLISSEETFIEDEKDADDFLNELSLAFSKENITLLSKDMKETDGYELKGQLLKRLSQLMEKYGISQDYAEAYSEKMLYVILEQIKDIEPEKYDQYFQKEWKEEEEKHWSELDTKLNILSVEIKSLREQNIEIYTAGEIDQELRRSTNEPSISIEFFEIDDENFRENFLKHKVDGQLYIRGKCREETIYCVINELWRINENRSVFVVRNKESWKHLRSNSIKNKILIPDFYSEEIVAIDGNTNIFVLDDNMPAYGHDVIKLRPRTIDTITRCLRDAGMDADKAQALISDTHGLFIPMKKRIFKGEYLKRPEWVDGISDRAKKVCMLLGQWEEIEGDKLIVESLYDAPYEIFMNEVLPYTKGEDPFLYEIRGNQSVSFSLASTENTWEWIDISITDPLWIKFEKLFVEVMNESESLFIYNNKERMLAWLDGEKLFWSETIRKGMTRTLIMEGFYNSNEKCQSEMDQLVNEILGYIKNEQQWIYISKFWTDLCEISPRAVIDRMNREMDEPTGLLKLFENQNCDVLFERNAYINILWGLEQFLMQKDFVWEGLRWLIRLDNYDYHYVSNSPKDIFLKVLCIWHNFSAITEPEQKIYAAQLVCESSDNGWNYVYESLPDYHNSIIGTLSTPKYREHITETDTTRIDIQTVANGYFKILLNHMNSSEIRWQNILQFSGELNLNQRKEIFENLLNEISRMNDDHKIADIKWKIRDIIYRNRYFASSSWALSDEQLYEYEQLLDEIHTAKPEYEYEYLFHDIVNFPLLHPVPFDESSSYDANIKLAEQLIQEKLEEFQYKGYNLETLAMACARYEQCTLGRYLAKYWSSGEWDLSLFELLLKAQPSGRMAIDYLGNVTSEDAGLYTEVIAMMKEQGYSDEVLAVIYREEALKTEKTPLIAGADKNIKYLFWSQPIALSGEKAVWAANDSRQNADLGVFLTQLYWLHQQKPLTAWEILQYFKNINDMPRLKLDQMTGWYVQQFLKVMQKAFLNDIENCIKVARIEIIFSNLIEWDNMKCFHHLIKTDPEIFIELVSAIFKRDHDSNKSDNLDKQIIHNIYRIYDKAQFCPGEKNGNVSKNDLNQWIEKFKGLLKANDQESLFGMLLGRLFSFSPLGGDGYKPCEAVREAIEEYADDHLIDSYAMSIFNQRGVYGFSAGREEKRMADEFQADAEYFEKEYPKTAQIYKQLSQTYTEEYERERLDAENGRL